MFTHALHIMLTAWLNLNPAGLDGLNLIDGLNLKPTGLDGLNLNPAGLDGLKGL